jgi:hypothetical protein
MEFGLQRLLDGLEAVLRDGPPEHEAPAGR